MDELLDNSPLFLVAGFFFNRSGAKLSAKQKERADAEGDRQHKVGQSEFKRGRWQSAASSFTFAADNHLKAGNKYATAEDYFYKGKSFWNSVLEKEAEMVKAGGRKAQEYRMQAIGTAEEAAKAYSEAAKLSEEDLERIAKHFSKNPKKAAEVYKDKNLFRTSEAYNGMFRALLKTSKPQRSDSIDKGLC